MSTIGKNPSIVQSPARKLAEELRAKKAQPEVKQAEAKPADAFGAPGVKRAGFAPLGLMQGGNGGMNARLGAMTGDLHNQIAPTSGPRLKRSEGGRVLTGDLSVHKAADLDALRGVEVLKGNLVIEESGLKGADLDAVRSLTSVEGSIALEGNRALQTLEAFSKLGTVDGNVYLGFNSGLTEVELNISKLGGAFIAEGNDQLTRLSLPKLTEIGRYAHLHENQALKEVDAPVLASISGQLSIVDNPSLKAVKTPSLTSVNVEAYHNGAKTLEGLPAA